MRAKKTPPPPVVQRAIRRDDLESVRAFAKAGGEKTADNKRIQKEHKEVIDGHFSDKRAQAQQRELESSNEHILPIDPEEVRDDQ